MCSKCTCCDCPFIWARLPFAIELYERRDKLTGSSGVACSGIGLTDLGSDAMDYVKTFAGIVGAHYPERLYKCAHPGACPFLPVKPFPTALPGVPWLLESLSVNC